MIVRLFFVGVSLALATALVGCRSGRQTFVGHQPDPQPLAGAEPAPAPLAPAAHESTPEQAPIELQAFALQVEPVESAEPSPSDATPEPPSRGEEIAPPEEAIAAPGSSPGAPGLATVIQSVRNHYPLIREAAAGRVVAAGEALSASGAFDRKFEGFSNVQPLDFYENHWGNWGVSRDTLWGGKVGAGYKLGRGSFEPWYQERETNDLGEFSLSLSAPIGRRDRAIDANRAELWRAQLERDRVEPFIRAEVIRAVNAGTQAYWKWVAAGADYRIADQVLSLGLNRVDFLTRQVELGEKARIDITDNRRVIVSRQAKRVDARRKLQQAAVKLSLFLRSPVGAPVVLPDELAVPEFPPVGLPEGPFFAGDVQLATANRPELTELAITRRQLAVAYQQALNETLVDVDGGVFLGQDVGNSTSSDDKSEFEIEATLTVSVPLERRKARGKVRQLQGKFTQIRVKQQFAEEKIATEVQGARAALVAAAERVQQTTEGVQLAAQMQDAERRLYESGQSTLFALNLREQQAAEAAGERVAAQLDFFLALADYTAALGVDDQELIALYSGLLDERDEAPNAGAPPR